MAKSLPKPDVDLIVNQIAYLSQLYDNGDTTDYAVLRRIRKMRNLDWKVNVPSRLEEVTQATGIEYRASDIADELLTLPTLYTDQPPSLSLSGGNDDESPSLEGLTTRIEQFTMAALLEDCGRRSGGSVGTFERVVDGTFEGGGWSALVKDKDVWSDYYAEAKQGADAIDDNGKPKYEDDPDEPSRRPNEAEDAYAKRKGSYKPQSKRVKFDRATEELKKKAGVPVTWRHVDALTVLPQYEGDRLVAVIEVQERSLSQCLRQYNLGFNELGEICPRDTAVSDWSKRCSGASVQFIQYWDREWMSYLIRYSGGFTGTEGGYAGSCYQIPGYTRRHKYNLGRPPYYSSLGWTKNYEYARVATWSASEPKRFLVEYLSFLRTVFAHLAIRDAIPPVAIETDVNGTIAIDPDTGEPVLPDKYELGMQYQLQKGQRLVPFQFPNQADKLQAEIVQTMKDIADLSPAQKRGDLGNMGGEGFALSLAFEKSRAMYSQFEKSIVQHLTDVTLDFWKLVASFDEPVYVRRRPLKVVPKDFEKALDLKWMLHVDSTAAKIILERYLNARKQNGSLGGDQVIERLGDNVDEVNKSIARDWVRASKEYQGSVIAEVMADWGHGPWQQAQQTSDQILQAAGQVNPGPQPVGGQPSPVPNVGSLAMSPNGAGAAPGTELGGQPSGTPSSPSTPVQAATAQVAPVAA